MLLDAEFMIGADMVGVDIVLRGDDGEMYGWCRCDGPEIEERQSCSISNLLFDGALYKESLRLSISRSVVLNISVIAEIS